jgi:hypothetical protein
VPSASCDPKAFRQNPGVVPLEFVQGNRLPVRCRFNRDLTGYTLSAAVVCIETGLPVCTFAVTKTAETVNGQPSTRVDLVLTEQQTALLMPPLTYRWAMDWVTPAGHTRTVMAGRVLAARR